VTLFIISVVLALAVSALCSLLEATLLSLTPSQVAELSSRQPRLGAMWQGFKSNIERPIAVILLINTAAHTIGATMAGAQFELVFGQSGVIWFSLVFTYLMLQFTEILPKTLGVLHNGRLAPVIVVPLAFLVRLLSPVLSVVHLVNRPFEGKRRDEKSAPLQEIAALAGLARISRYISAHQERVIKGAAQLSNKVVRDVMIPLDQITFLSASQTPNDALIAAHLDPHTRFPISEGEDRNRVLGYVNLKELVYLLRTNPGDATLRGIIRPVHFVTAEQPASELMRVFIDHHEHMAIVRDGQGKTAGLVTLEDVVEELVGELEDEFDRLPRHLHPLTGGIWMAGGGLPASELAQKTGLGIPDAQGSTSAWLIRRLGRTPKPNETVRVAGGEVMVRRVRRGCVFEVSVTSTRAQVPAAP
jgi:CBS domain containing-hemolysin-like protein